MPKSSLYKSLNGSTIVDTSIVEALCNLLCISQRYSYGLTGNVNDLPKVADIAKQIIYAEYIAEVMEPTADVYNAFIMPYSAASECEVMKHIGIAKTDWKRSHRPYEYAHGILVDSRYLERLQEAEYEQARSLLATTIIFGGPVKVSSVIST